MSNYIYNFNNFSIRREAKKVYHLFDIIDITDGKYNNLNINKNVYTNYSNNYYYNINSINIPSQRPNFVYSNNSLLININPEAHYQNFFC